MPLWETYIANSGYICSVLKLIKIKKYTMGLLSTVLEQVCEGFHLFLFFRKTADKNNELFHVYFSRILPRV